jgi:hypothetical protein
MSIELWNNFVTKNQYINQIGGSCCDNTLTVDPLIDSKLLNIIQNIKNGSFKTIEGIKLIRTGGYSGVGKAIIELPSKIKYMMKIGVSNEITASRIKTSYDHLLSEYLANCFYHLGNVIVPKMKKYIVENDGLRYFVILSEFIDGKMYSSIRGETESNRNIIKENLLKGFLIDCILNNDDMLGHELDNVIYKDNIPYRIDTGASFCFTGGGSIQYNWNDISVDKLLNWSDVIYNDHIPPRHTHIKNLQKNINEAIKSYYYKINPLKAGDTPKNPNTNMLIECFRHIYSDEELLGISKKLIECVHTNKDFFDTIFKDVYVESRKVPGKMIDHRDYFPVIVHRISSIYHFIYGQKDFI